MTAGHMREVWFWYSPWQTVIQIDSYPYKIDDFFIFSKDKLHVFKYSISNAEWALRSEYNYPFPIDRMKTQSILSSKDIQREMWFFLVGGGNNWVKISGTDSLNEETLYS